MIYNELELTLFTFYFDILLLICTRQLSILFLNEKETRLKPYKITYKVNEKKNYFFE